MKVKTMQRQNGKWIARCSFPMMAEGDTEADAIAALQCAESASRYATAQQVFEEWQTDPTPLESLPSFGDWLRLRLPAHSA